jgi:hypothetical protein
MNLRLSLAKPQREHFSITSTDHASSVAANTEQQHKYHLPRPKQLNLQPNQDAKYYTAELH